jgi:hypothetical protein
MDFIAKMRCPKTPLSLFAIDRRIPQLNIESRACTSGIVVIKKDQTELRGGQDRWSIISAWL